MTQASRSISPRRATSPRRTSSPYRVISLDRAGGSRGVARASRTAGSAGHETLRRRDLEVLGWLGEAGGSV